MNGREFSAGRTQMIEFPDAGQVRGKDRSTKGADVTQNGTRLKLAWHTLYALVGVAVLVFVVANMVAPTEGWRTLTEYLGAALILGLMALWVRANRSALAVAGDAADGEEGLCDNAACTGQPSYQQPLESSFNSQASRKRAAEEDPS